MNLTGSLDRNNNSTGSVRGPTPAGSDESNPVEVFPEAALDETAEIVLPAAVMIDLWKKKRVSQ